MSHLIIAPILLPLLSAICLLCLRGKSIQIQGTVHLALTSLLVVISLLCFQIAYSGELTLYLLGNWQAPFGIVLVLDRLSALLVLLTSILALAALWYGLKTETDRQGEHFHVLFQMQLFGINGAFLTGDLFNLFVFFEILLLASYGLMLHGGGRLRTRAGLHYLIVNMVGSVLFLFAVGTLYGVLGTLNIADLSVAIQSLPENNQSVVAAAGLLLLVVFGIKAAMFPLYLWLPSAYGYTSAPVAALFAIMTKVGLYAILRVHGTLFGEQAGALAYLYANWVLAAGLITLALGSLGVLAAKTLRQQVAYLVIASVATLLIAIGLASDAATSAMIYYLIHSTVIGAALFLLADTIARGRGSEADTFVSAAPIAQPILVGAVFMALAIAMTGMPPLSGFFGKVMILNAALAHPWFFTILTIMLVAGLIMIIAVARAGSILFYKVEDATSTVKSQPLNRPAFIAILGLFAFSPLMVALAYPVSQFTHATAAQLSDHQSYRAAVLSTQPAGIPMP